MKASQLTNNLLPKAQKKLLERGPMPNAVSVESTDLLCPFCGSDNVTTEYDIGYDIDPSGEERQHIDRCECGAWRFHTDCIHEFTAPEKHFGKWHEKDDDMWPLF